MQHTEALRVLCVRALCVRARARPRVVRGLVCGVWGHVWGHAAWGLYIRYMVHREPYIMQLSGDAGGLHYESTSARSDGSQALCVPVCRYVCATLSKDWPAVCAPQSTRESEDHHPRGIRPATSEQLRLRQGCDAHILYTL